VDAHRFDALARLVGRRSSRRGAVASLIATIAGRAALPNATVAKTPRRICRPSGLGCASNRQCCTGYCENRSSLPRRQRFRCACPPATIACDGACVDAQSSATHCGACDTPCGDDEACLSGACQCAPDLTPCADACVDTSSDVDHCGACDAACGPGETCEAGQCRCGADGGCGDFSTCFSGVCKLCEIEDDYAGCFRTIEDTAVPFNLGQWQGNVACDSSDDCATTYLPECLTVYTCFCTTGFSSRNEPNMWFSGTSVCAWAFV
jgi:hypothetical protein